MSPASLDRDLRLGFEDRLKRGDLRAVVCSTSLELGIDIGSIDLVVMLSTPRESPHRPADGTRRTPPDSHQSRTPDGNQCPRPRGMRRWSDLRARGRFESLRIPSAPLDVLGATPPWDSAASEKSPLKKL